MGEDCYPPINITSQYDPPENHTVPSKVTLLSVWFSIYLSGLEKLCVLFVYKSYHGLSLSSLSDSLTLMTSIFLSLEIQDFIG